MTKEYSLFSVGDFRISFVPSAIIAMIGFWIAFAGASVLILRMPIGKAVIVGLGMVILHWISGFAHQFGHAIAARSTGYPMIGIRMWGPLGTSLYPENEGTVPPEVHIRRALGGPLASLVMSAIAGLIVLSLGGQRGGALWYLAAFFLIDNFFMFTLQVFLPLGFNDASTILYWRKQLGQ